MYCSSQHTIHDRYYLLTLDIYSKDPKLSKLPIRQLYADLKCTEPRYLFNAETTTTPQVVYGRGDDLADHKLVVESGIYEDYLDRLTFLQSVGCSPFEKNLN